MLVECLGLDGDLERGYAAEAVRPALSAEDKRNMKLMQDRATATTRARHSPRASPKGWRSRTAMRSN